MAQTQRAQAHEPTIDAASDPARLEALASYDLLDTPQEPLFDHIARLVQNIFDVPIALVSLIDGHRQWYKAGVGLDTRETPLSATFCKYVLADTETMVIPDATLDSRVSANPMVTGNPNVRFYAGAPLQTPEGQTIGTVCAIDSKPRQFTPREKEMLEDLAGLAMQAMELRRLAAVDHLTGCLTRRAFLESGQSIFKLTARHREPLTCIAVDLDHFKSINDTYGHATGDAVLRAVAEVCRESLRDSDLLARIGGEEFIILLPRADEAAAYAKAERLRTAINTLAIPYGGRTIGVTASFGIATWDTEVTELHTLMERADAALYEAKAAGRNRSVIFASSVKKPVEAAPAARPTPPAVAPSPASLRRRVLKAGRIRYGNDAFTVDSTIRTLGQDGAGMDVSSSRDLPDTFELAIPADNTRHNCKVVLRSARHIEVAFI